MLLTIVDILGGGTTTRPVLDVIGSHRQLLLQLFRLAIVVVAEFPQRLLCRPILG